eukprot:6466069-Amphidinium_carterae.1
MQGEVKDDKLKTWKLDASGSLHQTNHVQELTADLSDGLRIAQALRRRGIAMCIADMLDYNLHEKLIKHYTETVLRTPPPGYASVGWGQVEQADMELWRLLTDDTKCMVKRDPEGARPLDKLLEATMYHPAVSMHLLPLPIRSGQASGSRGEGRLQSSLQNVKRPLSPEFTGAAGRKKQKGAGKAATKSKDR